MTSNVRHDGAADAHAYSPTPYVLGPTLGERVRELWCAVSLTPSRASLATLSIVMLVAVAFALWPVTVHATDARGVLAIQCGAQYFFGGHESIFVEQVCRNSYAGRAVLLTFASTTLTAALIALALLIAKPHVETQPPSARSRFWRLLVCTPGRASLATLAALALFTLIVSLVPMRVHGQDGLGAYSARCGISNYITGNDNATIEQACRRAYGSRAALLFVSTGVLDGAVVAMIMLVRSARRHEEELC